MSFLRAKKVLKYQFKVEAIVIFVKCLKKRHQVVYSFYTKARFAINLLENETFSNESMLENMGKILAY